MTKPFLKFPLSSEQLELLLGFESNGSIQQLSETVSKDPSVISRNLQRISELLPVIAKNNGRWKITTYGRDLNVLTRKYLEDLHKNRPIEIQKLTRELDPLLSESAALVIINAQNALLDPGFGPRNNVNAEKNILYLLQRWRKLKKPVFHVKHVMDEPGTPFYIESEAASILPMLAPIENEVVIEKRKASAFTETGLATLLEAQGIKTVILTGFTANECIDATAKQASETGFTTFVVGDATAMFDVPGPGGSFHKADRVHRLVLANLHAFFATILETADLKKRLDLLEKL